MKKLLIPFNFDEDSKLALNTALGLFKNQGHEITLLHIVYFPNLSNAEQIEPFGIDRKNIVKKLMKNGEENLKQIVKSLNHSGNNIRVKVLDGHVASQVTEFAKNWSTDLMILAQTKNTYKVEDHFFGTLTDKIIRKSEVPVLVVKKKPNHISLKKALISDEFSDQTEQLLKIVTSLRSFTENPEIHIVRINTPLDFMGQNIFDERVGKFREIPSLSDCAFHSINYTSHGDGLIYYANKLNAEVIVIARKHKSGLRRWIVGEDLAEKIMDYTIKPVLIF